MKRILFRTLKTALLLVVVSGLALAAWMAYATRHFYDGYDPGLPLETKASEPVAVEKSIEAFDQPLEARYRRVELSFAARPGERVPAILTLPLEGEGPFPVIVLLHGSHQEKEFVEEICTPFNEAGFAMACFDQYMRGGRRVKGSPLTFVRAFRERSWKTVHDTRRLMDCLQTRPDIIKDRIYLIGASYGAITGTACIAQEKRIRAACLVVGGGKLSLMADAPDVRKELPPWLPPVVLKLFAAPIMGPAEPLRHAAASAGIPVLMQNGLNDRVVIPESGKVLFAALGEPKEIRWYPIDHPDREPKGGEVIAMLQDGLEWLVQQDAEIKAKGQQSAPLREEGRNP